MSDESHNGDVTFTTPVEILLVDDDTAWARGTGRLLEHNVEAFSVEIADSLEAGRKQYENREPALDCIVCDYQLGDGTGIELLETVRQTDDELPFILVTGRGDEAVASEATREGITEYIIKRNDGKEADLLRKRISNAVQNHRTERQLERERRSKETLLELMTAAADELTLYQECCQLLADEHGFECVWIGTTTEQGNVVPRAVAGAAEYTEDVIRTPSSEGTIADPVRRALESNEPVVYDANEDTVAGCAEWSDPERRPDIQSAAGIPLTHQGMVFGILGVCSTVPAAIDDAQLALLEEFAETIGYATHTAEFRRSLLSDRPITIDIELSSDTIPLVTLQQSIASDCQFTIPSVVLRDDGTTFYLTSIDGASGPAVMDAVEAVDWATLADNANLGEASPPLQSGIIVDTNTPESVLAEQGAELRRLSIEEGVQTVTVNVPGYDIISELEATLASTFEEAAVTSIKRQPDDRQRGTSTDLLEPLTSKQADALRQAYYEGFFDHPRGITATELAGQFNVTRQTLTYHLRTAERKVFEQVYENGQ